jgi:tetratricopeptide (TPR) repeat protein
MKTCPSCSTSLPDFVNVCTKCKYNFASPPPPVKPTVTPSAPAPTPAAPRVPPRPPVTNQATETTRVEPPKQTQSTEVAPEKSKKMMYFGIAVVVLLALSWLGSSDSDTDSAKLAKEQAAAEVAKARAEASEAREQAQKAQEQADQLKQQADQLKQQAAAIQNAPTQAESPAQVSDLLARAAKCTVNDCIDVLFLATQPRNREAIQVAAGRYAEFNTLKTGDRPAGRDLNNKGLAQLRAGNINGAIDLFNRAALADPNDSEVMANLGYALVKANRLNEAEKALNLAIIINPRRTATWGAVSEYFAKKPNNTEVAVRALQLAYEFSGGRDKTLQFFTDSADTSDRPEMRPIYAEAVRRIRAY